MATYIGTNGDDTIQIFGDEEDDIIFGLGGDDHLNGFDGDDIVVGGAGADKLFGGFGNNTASYQDAQSGVIADLILFTSGANTGDADGDTYNRIQNLPGSNFGDSLRGTNGVNRLDGGEGGDILFGRGGDDDLFGGVGDDTLVGGIGADSLFGAIGTDAADYTTAASAVKLDLDEGGTLGEADDDTYSSIENVLASNFGDAIGGNAFDNVIFGFDGADVLRGKEGDDSLRGDNGNDRLFGGAGADRIFGGSGTDIADYTDAASAVSLDLDTGGILGDADGDIYDGIEIVVGSTFGDTLRGRATESDEIFGLGGDDAIFGEGGSDILRGEGGSDTLDGGAGIDFLFGGSGDDSLDGGEGVDLMHGESGSDTYFVDNVDDLVNEAAPGSSGTDRIVASISFSLADQSAILGDVENLTLTGTANLDGTGNDLANEITGNAGANTLIGGGGGDTLNGGGGNDVLQGGAGFDQLNGGLGADIMQGGADNDFYEVDNAGDVVDESVPDSSGEDFVLASISFSLGNTKAVRGSVENLSLTGTANINGAGNSLDNLIFGNAGNNILDGGAGNDGLAGDAGNDRLDGGSGADQMEGGAGNDVYVVDNVGDTVNEGPSIIDLVVDSGGIDTVEASISFSLSNPARVIGLVENLILVNVASALNATGNALANAITGNDFDNILDGAAGADRLEGGLGDDIYIVDRQEDIVIETAGNGAVDRVMVRDSYALAQDADIELFTTVASSATTAINLTGNALAQEIFGNAGSNILHDGGPGKADILRGLEGNDTYRVFNSGDTIIESSTQGTADRVMAAVNYLLGQGVHVESLTTNGSTGTADLRLTGNEFAQEILGNAGDNRLEGKGGNDTLRGFGGADSFVFATALGASNVDTIVDFNVADDRFLLSDAVFTALATGVLAAAAFRVNTTGAAGDASDRIIYESDTGKLFYDADGTGATAGILFATVTAGLALTNADFSVA